MVRFLNIAVAQFQLLSNQLQKLAAHRDRQAPCRRHDRFPLLIRKTDQINLLTLEFSVA